ncbi:MAG: phosphoribosylanthranilate isomerase [Verrucomicrobia bacterium]|nr:phosphoribosylanthranilate isomerase [Verrucomicrobiota bacterium]
MNVKICGLTNIADARVARDAGADYFGFIFYAKSPRAVSPEQVAQIVGELGDGARAIGVFVNERPEQIREIVAACGLYAAQVHGDELAEDFAALPLRLWRAMRIEDGVAVPDPAAWSADCYVIDAAVPGQYGGTGVTADWHAAARIAQDRPVLLAGGLHPGNVREAIRCVSPMGVDVSSGVELEPGRKDHEAVRRFIALAKGME